MKFCSTPRGRNNVASRLVAIGLLLVIHVLAQSAEPSVSKSIDVKSLANIDQCVNESIKKGDLPGAVVLIIHRGQVVYRKAFGHRAVKPAELPMLADTVFDLASLTKPIAPATSVMILIERGKLRLTDRVGRILPEFRKNGKEKITIEHLLLHTSGLTADNPEAGYLGGREKALENINKLSLEAEPGKRFRYSDVGYIVLGQVVEKVAGKPLNEYCREQIFEPLGMKDTTFLPNEVLKRRAAPNDLRKGEYIQGEVHDPRAFHLGGVAGHAGLFSTADDLALYVQVLLGEGHLNEKRILSPLAVKLMTTPRSVPLESTAGLRSFGWDVDTPFSSNRGELFPRGESFGHTGFTGTSIWIDPASETGIIILSNRLHPDGKGNVIGLRNRVATIVAASLREPRASQHRQADSSPPIFESVGTGIDMMEKEGCWRLRGRVHWMSER
jgi:serine-type D-Ala-D-Ala carboxypeptidase